MRAIREVERLDARCLRLRRSGVKPARIAKVCNVSLRTVYNGIAREREREAAARRAVAVHPRGPRLTLDHGSSCKPLPLLTCDDIHPGGEIPRGSRITCGKCYKSGLDHLPVLQIKPGEMPKPEPKPKVAGKTDKPATRKQRRKAVAQSQAA